MAPNPLMRSSANPLNVIALIVIVGVLYFARDICIPFIFAVLLSFVLSPLVSRLQKWRVPRVPAVFLVVGLLLLTLGLCGWLVGGQLVSLAERLPQYQTNVHEKLKSFRTSTGGLVDRLNITLDNYTKEIESIGSRAPAPGGGATLPADRTVAAPADAVATTNARPSKVAAIERLMLGVVSPMTTSGIVIILSLFMLIRQEDLRDRVIRLLGGGQLPVATQALDDAGARVSRYLLIQLIVNASFGVCIGCGLFILGVPYSLLWGLLAACLRFVPYFGAPIAAVAPLLLAFAATAGLGRRRVDLRAVRGPGVGDRECSRAMAVRIQRPDFAAGHRGVGGILVLVVGAGGLAPVDSVDGLSGGDRPACAAVVVSERDFGG